MELRHLRYFCAVADAGGFARAAALIRVSQSAMSEQMRDLEEELGVPLFDRRERRARLTAHGQVFLEEARRTLAAAERAREAALRSARGEVGTLTIGFFVGGTDSMFPKLIRAFREHSPGVRVALVELTPTEQHEALLSGAIDIGFTRALQSPQDDQLRAERFYVEPLVVALPAGHRLARQPVAMRQLATERFVIAQRHTSPVLFDKVIALCREAEFSPNIAATASVASGVLTLVAAGEGIAILPKGAQKLASEDVVFSPIQHPDASIDLVVAWSPRRESLLHRSFLELFRRCASGLPEESML